MFQFLVKSLAICIHNFSERRCCQDSECRNMNWNGTLVLHIQYDGLHFGRHCDAKIMAIKFETNDLKRNTYVCLCDDDDDDDDDKDDDDDDDDDGHAARDSSDDDGAEGDDGDCDGDDDRGFVVFFAVVALFLGLCRFFFRFSSFLLTSWCSNMMSWRLFKE